MYCNGSDWVELSELLLLLLLLLRLLTMRHLSEATAAGTEDLNHFCNWFSLLFVRLFRKIIILIEVEFLGGNFKKKNGQKKGKLIPSL